MHVFLRPAVALLLLAACAQPAPSSEAGLEAAEEAAISLVDAWAATATEGRWADLPSLFADEPGFAWVEQGEVRYADHAAIETAAAQALVSGVAVQTTIVDVEAKGLSPDVAAVEAIVSILFGDPAAGGFEFDGVLTAVAVEREGQWVFLQGHLSQPQAPPQRGAVRERLQERRAAEGQAAGGADQRAARRAQFIARRRARLSQGAPQP
jgi:hypothetical protein